MQFVYLLQVGIGEQLQFMTEFRPIAASLTVEQLQQAADSLIAEKSVQDAGAWSDTLWLSRKIVEEDGTIMWYIITTVVFVGEELRYVHS